MSRALPFGRAALLGVALAGVAAVALSTPAEARRSERGGVPLSPLGKHQLTDALVRSGAVHLRARPEVFAADPPADVGVLELCPAGGAEAALPSTEMAAALARRHPEREFVSIAVDPRDLDDPLRGLRTHPFEKGGDWQRGACVTFFEGGEAVAASTVGLCVHGGTSRGRSRTSWRLLFQPAFGAGLRPAAILPGARGDNLVLHSDWRRQPFVNPIGYELLARQGCDAPRTRPVRVVLNGDLQPKIYFATERVDASYLRERFGDQRLQLVREHDDQEPQSYVHLLNRVNAAPEFVAQHASRVMDTEAAASWLAGVLVLAPYDCKQGVAYRSARDRRWRWVCWDVDWGLGPWPTEVMGRVVKHRHVVEALLSPSRDLRLAWFQAVMRRESAGRARMLKEVRAALEHDDAAGWWRDTLARYRATARRLLGPGDASAAERRALDAIEDWVEARPEALRAELTEACELSPPRQIRVKVAAGCAVLVEGRRYERDWTGHAFDGERIELAAAAGAECFVGGEPSGQAVSLLVTGDVRLQVRPR